MKKIQLTILVLFLGSSLILADQKHIENLIYETETTIFDKIEPLSGDYTSDITVAGYLWGSYLIDRLEYPVVPYAVDIASTHKGFYIANLSAEDINIRVVDISVLSETPHAREYFKVENQNIVDYLNQNINGITLKQKDEVDTEVLFHPTEVGYHEIVFAFKFEGISLTEPIEITYSGTGLLPNLSVSDISYGQMLINDESNAQTGQFMTIKNKEDEFGYPLTVEGIIFKNPEYVSSDINDFQGRIYKYDGNLLPTTIPVGESLQIPVDFLARFEGSNSVEAELITNANTDAPDYNPISKWNGVGSESAPNEQTVGLFYNTPESYDGYTLFAPLNSKTTYLIDNCGKKVHSWESEYSPGASVYLLENGLLLRTGKYVNKNFAAGGSGGIIEMIDWDGNVVWDYVLSDDSYCLHHDIEYLPNGNILAIAWKAYSKEEALQAGRAISPDILWSEIIIEIKPDLVNGGGEIVWQWDAWDHLVQNVDSESSNFGDVTSPELININFSTRGFDDSDWLHFNSIDYNPKLDQIMLSNHNFGEIWIIDHSTTTQEAATHSGGNYGKGGDLIYRWGNPTAYGIGKKSFQKLFLQHDPHWIKDGLKDAGKIMVFNNIAGTLEEKNYSAVHIISPPVDENNKYILENAMFGPLDFDWTYKEDPDTNFYARAVSGAQRLTNGNTLICNGWNGDIFEIDDNKYKVWKYVNPSGFQGRLAEQGENLNDNQVFRAERFSRDYPAFAGKDLSPQGYLESGSDFTCQIFDGTSNIVGTIDNTNISIEIINNEINITSPELIDSYHIYNLSGGLVATDKFENIDYRITTDSFLNGIYLIRLTLSNGNSVVFKFLSE